jgi:hypothetical protein
MVQRPMYVIPLPKEVHCFNEFYWKDYPQEIMLIALPKSLTICVGQFQFSLVCFIDLLYLYANKKFSWILKI